MTTPDLGRYERFAALQHTLLSRAGANFSALSIGACHRRKCRRDGYCTGPMMPSSLQEGAVRAKRALGLSGDGVACLPICVANAGPALRRLFFEHMDRIQKIYADKPHDELENLRRYLGYLRRHKFKTPRR